MKSNLTKAEKRRRKVLRSLRSTIKHNVAMLKLQEERIVFLEKQLATKASTVISTEVMELRWSFFQSAQCHELDINLDCKDMVFNSMTRQIVRLPSFRLGYRHVFDMLMMRRGYDVADMLAKVVNDIGSAMATELVDSIIKTTPEFRRINA